MLMDIIDFVFDKYFVFVCFIEYEYFKFILDFKYEVINNYGYLFIWEGFNFNLKFIMFMVYIDIVFVFFEIFG